MQTASPCGRARAAEGWPQNIAATKKSSGNASDKLVVQLNRRSWQVSLFLNDVPTGSVTAHKGSTAASRIPAEDNMNTSGLLHKMLADHEPPGSSCKLQGTVSDSSVMQSFQITQCYLIYFKRKTLVVLSAKPISCPRPSSI